MFVSKSLLLFCFAGSLWAQSRSPIFKPLPVVEDSTATLTPSSTVKDDEKPEQSKSPGTEVISGIVRVVRGNPQSEVFFIDRKDSLIIPRDSHHNEIFEACLASSRTRSPVQLLIQSKTRTILSLQAPDKNLINKELSSTEPSSKNLNNSSANPGSK